MIKKPKKELNKLNLKLLASVNYFKLILDSTTAITVSELKRDLDQIHLLSVNSNLQNNYTYPNPSEVDESLPELNLSSGFYPADDNDSLPPTPQRSPQKQIIHIPNNDNINPQIQAQSSSQAAESLLRSHQDQAQEQAQEQVQEWPGMPEQGSLTPSIIISAPSGPNDPNIPNPNDPDKQDPSEESVSRVSPQQRKLISHEIHGMLRELLGLAEDRLRLHRLTAAATLAQQSYSDVYEPLSELTRKRDKLNSKLNISRRTDNKRKGGKKKGCAVDHKTSSLGVAISDPSVNDLYNDILQADIKQRQSKDEKTAKKLKKLEAKIHELVPKVKKCQEDILELLRLASGVQSEGSENIDDMIINNSSNNPVDSGDNGGRGHGDADLTSVSLIQRLRRYSFLTTLRNPFQSFLAIFSNPNNL